MYLLSHNPPLSYPIQYNPVSPKVLVKVFQSVLLTVDHDHLRTFYIIIPALCISWTDAALQAKDNMFKVTRASVNSAIPKEMYYADDGFAMGVAYCLAILKQVRVI
jgi:WASH complex subunit 7